MRLCPICYERECGGGMCHLCAKSYNMHIRHDDGTLQSIVEWAAKRARWFESRRHRKAAKR